MWQGPWFVVLLFSCRSVAQTLIQTKASMTVPVGKTARILCQVHGGSVSSSYPLHWYQQKPGKPLQWILYYGDRKVQTPTIHLLPPDREEEKNDKFFVACLMTNFFPEVIKVEWEINDQKRDKNILTEPVKEEHGNYSLISRLQVSRVEWETQKIACLVTHEASSTIKLLTSAQDRDAAQKNTQNLEKVTCPSTDAALEKTTDEDTPYASLRVATLTYTALLTKSVLYCFIISFVVYKMESRGAKKPM
ncbi:immunoglobulin kappa light chain-like [Hemitrygon akajei]|uniref:immunoglobulin kappa light chain-like n=1 Tax=Hemitrygon akajei TaxID=2704970 RepID=UPI003BF94AD9